MRRVKATAAVGDGETRSEQLIDRSEKRLDALTAVLDSTVRVIVWTVAFFAVLHYAFGVSVGPLLAGFGVIGFAIGFGAQDLVKDFISGFFMLIEDQFGVGDFIDAGDASGWVEDFSLRTTTLRDIHGTLWHIPNGEIRRVGNESQEWSRALLDIGVAYGADIDQAAAIIKEAANEVWRDPEWADGILDEPDLWGVESLDDSAVVIRLVVKTTPGDQWAIARELRRRIKLALDAADVEIPFPQRTVWLRNDDESVGPVEARDTPEPVFKRPKQDGHLQDSDGD